MRDVRTCPNGSRAGVSLARLAEAWVCADRRRRCNASERRCNDQARLLVPGLTCRTYGARLAPQQRRKGEWGHDYRRHGEAIREVNAFKQTELYRDQEDAKEAIIAAEKRAARFGY